MGTLTSWSLPLAATLAYHGHPPQLSYERSGLVRFSWRHPAALACALRHLQGDIPLTCPRYYACLLELTAAAHRCHQQRGAA